jgi:hypothetical protein
MSDSMFDRVVKFNTAERSFRDTSVEELIDRVERGIEVLDSVAEDLADADAVLPEPRLRPDLVAWYRFVEASDLVRQMREQGR